MKLTDYPLATTVDGTEQTVIDQAGMTKRAPLSLLMGSAGGLFYSGFYPSLDAAVAAIGATPGTLIIHDAIPVIANTAVPTTLAVLCTGGADVQVPTGVTATFNGPFDAPLKKVFTLTGTGLVAFGRNAVSEFLPEWWGAVGDFSYSNTGTENQAAIQACFNAAAVIVGTGPNNHFPMVKLSPNQTYLTGNVTLDGGINLDMRGARLQAAVSRGTYNFALPLLTINASAPGAFYWGLSVGNDVFFNFKFDPAYKETNIGIKFANANNADVILGHMIGFYIMVQFYGLSSYTTVRGGLFTTCKIGIDLRTGPSASGYFVNEMNFHDCNISVSSNMANYGQIVGVRFSSDDDGQHGQNNNRFDGLCFQVSNHANDWAASSAKTQYLRYATGSKYWIFMSANSSNGTNAPPPTLAVTFNNTTNFMTFATVGGSTYGPQNNRQIYIANTDGTGVAPTNLVLYTWYWIVNASGNTCQLSATKGGGAIDFSTDGSGNMHVEAQEGIQWTDDAGKVWQCEGPQFRCPWLVDDTSASSCTVTRCRWEGGYGPFLQIFNRRRFTNTNQFNLLCEPYSVQSGVYANLGDLESHTAIDIQHFPIDGIVIKGYSGNTGDYRVEVDDFATRMLGSAQGYTIAGMAFVQTTDWNTIQRYVNSGTLTLFRSYVRFQLGGNWNAGIWVDTSQYKRWAALPELVSAAQWFVLKAYDRNFQSLTNDNYSKTLACNRRYQAGSGGHWDNAANIIYGVGFAIPNVPNQPTHYVLVGVNAHGALAFTGMRSVSVATADPAVVNASAIRVVTPFGSVLDRRRYSKGIPTIGIMNAVGEFIENINSGANEPLGWTVKTAGAMAPALANGTGYTAGQLLVNGPNVYAPQANGTSGGAATTNVTGTGIGINDGSGYLWDFQFPLAALEAVLPATKDPTTGVLAGATFAQHALTGAQEVYHINTNATPGTLTTRTATEMISDQGAGTSGSWKVRIINNSDAGAVLTIGLGSGVTNPLSTTLTIAQDKFGDFLFTITGAGAITIARVGTGDHV